jgi:hypothetical protein
MAKAKILQEAKAELERHVWGTFVEGKASGALGGTGLVLSLFFESRFIPGGVASTASARSVNQALSQLPAVM